MAALGPFFCAFAAAQRLICCQGEPDIGRPRRLPPEPKLPSSEPAFERPSSMSGRVIPIALVVLSVDQLALRRPLHRQVGRLLAGTTNLATRDTDRYGRFRSS